MVTHFFFESFSPQDVIVESGFGYWILEVEGVRNYSQPPLLAPPDTPDTCCHPVLAGIGLYAGVVQGLSVVVITFALHAKGHGFEPRSPY